MQTPENMDHAKSDTEGRILSAATSLFGKLGYYGTSTRDIASAAEVSEITVYRHYPRKRDLYVAVLTAELEGVSVRGDLLAGISQAADARTALKNTFELISATVTRKPELLRLVLYSALEMGPDLDSLLKLHLGELVEVLAKYLEPWVSQGGTRSSNSKALILVLISIAVFHWPLNRVFPAVPANPRTAFEEFAETCVRMGSIQLKGGAQSAPIPRPTNPVGQ